jgi:hypothetical protein
MYPRVVSEIETEVDNIVEDNYVLYENHESDIVIYANELYVAKVFGGLHDGMNRCYTEYRHHLHVYESFPENVLQIHDYFIDTYGNSCIIYERAYDISTYVYENKIEDLIMLIKNFNDAGFYHLDTKISNFLQRDSGELLLHDWGLCCVKKILNPTTQEALFKSQMRLLFTCWENEDKPPYNVLQKYDIIEIFNLSVDTMYTDNYFKNIEHLQDVYVIN